MGLGFVFWELAARVSMLGPHYAADGATPLRMLLLARLRVTVTQGSWAWRSRGSP